MNTQLGGVYKHAYYIHAFLVTWDWGVDGVRAGKKNYTL